MKQIFKPADILLPRAGIDLTKWAVVACDQHTSNRTFWEETAKIVGDAPSTLNLVLPEVFLEDRDVEDRILKIYAKMDEYRGLLEVHEDAVFYVERTQIDGRVRRGVVGVIDLEEYDYKPNSKSLVRASEQTIEERIPPRLRVREGASLELPHIMLLIDDPECKIIEGLNPSEILYDFELMQCGGHIKGFKLCDAEKKFVVDAINNLAGSGLALAVGDGNHSLATARAHYDKHKNPLARYALVEVVNLHSPALDFEPIHRVLTGVDPEHVKAKLKKLGEEFSISVLQRFIDEYVARFGGAVDYIHGFGEAQELGDKPRSISIILGGLCKVDLFPLIKKNGCLPRKTFSMGESIHGEREDKRFYLEARNIKV